MDQRSDRELLKGYARDRSEAAFAALVHRHVNLVFSVAARIVVDPQLAEDVAQTVFVILAKKARALVQVDSLTGWLHATARNQAALKVRSEVRRRAREREASLMNTPDSAQDPDWSALEPKLDEAIGELPAQDRAVLLLRYFERKSGREIAAQLRLTEEAAQKRIQRALPRLRELLARRGVRSTTASLATGLALNAVRQAPASLGSRILEPALAAGIASTLTLSHIFLALMTTKKWTAAALAASTAVAFAPLIMEQSPLPPEVQIQFPAPIAPRQSPPAPPPSPPPTMNWAEIESADYRAFIANLRASGAPEQLIRDAVALEIQGLYAGRSRAIRARAAPASNAYWRKPSAPELSAEQHQDLAELNREQRAVLAELLGSPAKTQDAVNLLFLQPDFQSVGLAWLEPETSEKAAALLEPVLEAELNESLRQREGSIQPQIQWMDRRIEALKDLLSPAQLEEYRRRHDQQLDNLRNLTRHSSLTEEEFNKIAESKWSILINSDVSLDRRQEQQRRLTALLGPERASNFIKTTDVSYANARRAADAFGLPADAADRVWDHKQAALNHRDRLLQDPNLTPETLGKEIDELAARTQAGYAGILGPDGVRLVLSNERVWWDFFQKTPSPRPTNP